jgi:ubiquinone/menaquinone biosynthesis C-methylase UbiE
MDQMAANGVDIVIDDVYSLSFESNSIDAVVSSSCFEHAEFFRMLFNEASRLLKPRGICTSVRPRTGRFIGTW